MNQLTKFLQAIDEADDLNNRFFKVYPARRNEIGLKKRHEAGDKNVVCYMNENHEVSHYELEFTKAQRQELESLYKRTRKGYDERMDKGYEAKVFVSIIEGHADNYYAFPLKPQSQKDRVRSLEKVIVALYKLEEALGELDSGALGYLYAHVFDASVRAATDHREGDKEFDSMLDHPYRAVVEGGEFRGMIRELTPEWVNAVRSSADTLPKFDHHHNDPRLREARALERLMLENQMPFEPTEGSAAAAFLRAIFELAGEHVDKVSYWLKKAHDDPDSFARFREKMRREYDGENPPAV